MAAIRAFVDIDEVLCNTALGWVKEMIPLFGNPENLTPEELVKKYPYVQLAPFWQSEAARTWVEKAKVEPSRYLTLPQMDNASQTLKELVSAGKIKIAAYLTMRDDKLEAVTREWLTLQEFPTAQIIARPDNVEWDRRYTWKAELVASKYPDVEILVDDHLKVIDALPGGYKGTCILFGQEESPRKDIDVIPCATWAEVAKTVEMLHGIKQIKEIDLPDVDSMIPQGDMNRTQHIQP